MNFSIPFSKISKEKLKDIVTYNIYVRERRTKDLVCLLVCNSPLVSERYYSFAKIFEENNNLS